MTIWQVYIESFGFWFDATAGAAACAVADGRLVRLICTRGES